MASAFTACIVFSFLRYSIVIMSSKHNNNVVKKETCNHLKTKIQIIKSYSGSFSLIYVGSRSHCLRFSFFQIIQTQNHPNTAQSPTSRLWCLSNSCDALQAHMHPIHKLGNANTVASYHNYQTLIRNNTAIIAAGNVYRTLYGWHVCWDQVHHNTTQDRNPVP